MYWKKISQALLYLASDGIIFKMYSILLYVKCTYLLSPYLIFFSFFLSGWFSSKLNVCFLICFGYELIRFLACYRSFAVCCIEVKVTLRISILISSCFSPFCKFSCMYWYSLYLMKFPYHLLFHIIHLFYVYIYICGIWFTWSLQLPL